MGGMKVKAKLRAKVRDLKRELILEEAGAYFESVGLEAAKMAEVAARCGISVGALYKVFPSKDALFYAYIGHQIGRFLRELETRAAAAATPEEKLRVFASLKYETFCEKAKVIKDPLSGDPLFFTKLNLSHENPAAPVYDWLADRFSEVGFSGAEALKQAYRFSGMLLGDIEYWLVHGGTLAGEEAAAVERFLHGVTPKGKGDA